MLWLIWEWKPGKLNLYLYIQRDFYMTSDNELSNSSSDTGFHVEIIVKKIIRIIKKTKTIPGI